MDPNNPPMGIPPLVWLLIWLIGGPATIALLCTKAASKLPGFLGALGRWWQNREPAARSYRVSQEEIARLNSMYDELKADFNELRREVRKLNGELTAEKREKWSLLAYVRVLIDSHRRHAPNADVPDAPVDLHKYL